MSINEKIRHVRNVKGISQEYMSNELKVCQSTYCRWENGHTCMKVEELMKILELLNLEPEDMIGEELRIRI